MRRPERTDISPDPPLPQPPLETGPAPPPAEAQHGRSLLRRIHPKLRPLLILLIVLVGVVIAGLLLRRPTAPAYFTEAVTRGTLVSTVEATGTVNAVITVQVGSQVSGTISRILVDFNSHVRQGQLIAEIDPTVYRGQVLQAQADLENARASLGAARTSVDAARQDILTAQANEEKANAALVQSRLDLQRTTPLARQGIVSAQQFDQVQATYRTNLAAYHAAQAATQQSRAKLKTTQAQQLQAAAQVQLKQAALDVSHTNLAHCRITSPIDGTVINRAVDVGQTVAASFQTPTLFTIAQDLNKMQVYAATDESDVGRIRVGDAATFLVDAFPHETFHGEVTQIRMNATTVQNVVQYNTIIDFDNPGGKLFPGMTAYVTIPVATARDTLKVPNAALRFTPDLKPQQLQALLQRYGVERPREPVQPPAAPARPASGTPAQPAALARAPAAPRPQEAILWKLDARQQLVPVRVRIGITDFTNTAVTQVLQGSLGQGDRVVTGVAAQRSASAGRSPLGGMGGRPPMR